MPNDGKNQSIWAWKNTSHITKMGIEGTIAVASLATAMATILISTNVIAVPTFLVSVANPVGITALFIAAVYFTAATYSSYQQMYKNEEINLAVKKVESTQEIAKKAEAVQKKVFEENAKGFATKDELNAIKAEFDKKLDSGKFKEKVREVLPTIIAEANVIQALENSGFQKKTS